MSTIAIDLASDPEAAAHAAGLRYVDDEEPGIRRRRRGSGFSYHAPDGSLIEDEDEVERVRALAVPPAWTDVWICARDDGHIQATGRDDDGRKQYRYHDRWREARDAIKFERLGDFGAALPDIRERVDRDLRRPRVDRPRVLALLTRLLDHSLIRVGNDEYFEDHGSVGLTTMRRAHVEVDGERIRFCFPGKGGKEVEVELTDGRSARAIRRCLELPGECVFQHGEGEEPTPVTSADVNAYLEEAGPQRATAKDFRTWGGTVEVVRGLAGLEVPDDARERHDLVLHAVDAAAGRLGNTRAVCRSGYVHPGVVDAYEEGLLAEASRRAVRRRRPDRLDEAEHVLLTLLDLL